MILRDLKLMKIDDIVIKLNRANALIFKIRNYTNRHILGTIYFGIFHTHINYASLQWSLNLNTASKLLPYKKDLKNNKLSI